MKKQVFFIIFALLCLLFANALAEIRVYTYADVTGGVHGMDASTDGRILITGMTQYEKKTGEGQDAYALCIDAQGNELWRFTERIGELNEIISPVFLEDGGAAMLLYGIANISGGQWEQMELLHMGADGELASRRMLEGMTINGGREIERLRGRTALDNGFLLGEREGHNVLRNNGKVDLWQWEGTYSYYVYDVNGNRLRELKAMHGLENVVVSSAHALMQEENGDIALFSIAGNGDAARLATVFAADAPAYIESLISLPDGGAVASGWRFVEDENGDGLSDHGCFVARWDARGDLVFETKTDAESHHGLVKTGDGFAVLCMYVVEGERYTLRRELTFFGEDGQTLGALPFDGVGLPMIEQGVMLEDGSLALADTAVVDETDSTFVLRVAIIPKEDIP